MKNGRYRGKIINTEEWAYGDLVHGVLEQKGKMFIYSESDRLTSGILIYEVIPETVGQSVGGLEDNCGKEIFDGDIVVLDDDVKRTFDVEDGIVTYVRGGFYIDKCRACNSIDVLATYDYSKLRGKIIGNIHDNPEVLFRLGVKR